jgi:hypothetical protein
MIAHFAAYLKIRSLKPNFSSILEIGPGSGEIEILHMLLGQPGERKVYERNDIFKLVEEKLAEKQRKHSTI